MKKIIFILLVIILIFLVYWVRTNYMTKKSTIKIGGQEFKTEIVSTQDQLERGLGGRDNLCVNCAMLFVFPQGGRRAFWMKDMKFDLDIIWLENDKITYIARNIPFDSKEVISPPVLADKVLEINAGLSDKYGFKAGDAVEMKL